MNQVVVQAKTRHPIKYFVLEGVTPGLRNREWSGRADPVAFEDGTTETGRNFREGFDPFGTVPTFESVVTSMRFDDTDNAQSVDFQIIDGWIIVPPEDVGRYRYSTPSEGYYALFLGQCGGHSSLISELGKNFGPVANSGPEFVIPAGIHTIEGWNIDSGGANSNWNFEFNDGTGWVNANNRLMTSLTQPRWTPLDGWLCDDGTYETLDGSPLVFSDTVARCEPVCVANTCCGSTGGGGDAAPDTPLGPETVGGTDIPNNTTDFALPITDAYTVTVTREGAGPVVINTGDGIVTMHSRGSRTFGTFDRKIDVSAFRITTGANSNADAIWER